MSRESGLFESSFKHVRSVGDRVVAVPLLRSPSFGSKEQSGYCRMYGVAGSKNCIWLPNGSDRAALDWALYQSHQMRRLATKVSHGAGAQKGRKQRSSETTKLACCR